MNLPLQIALRLQLRRTSDGRKSSPGVAIATVGVAIAVAVMLLSVGIASGFKQQIYDKISGFDASLTVSAPSNEPITISEALLRTVSGTLPDGFAAAPSVDLPAIVKTDSAFCGLVVRSLPDESASRFIIDNIVEGEPRAAADGEIIISRATALQLGIGLGDRPFVCYFVDGGIKSRRATVSAIYDTHFADFDTQLAWSSATTLRRVGRLSDDQATNLLIYNIVEPMIDTSAARLQNALTAMAAQSGGRHLEVSSVHSRGALYFSWLDLLDTNVVVILSLMAIVAAFTLVASTFIIILERVQTISILKTLGMTNNSIRSIFVWMGLRIVTLGLAAGNAIGLGVLVCQGQFRFIPLNPDTYYLDAVPVQIDWLSVAALNIAAIILTAFILLIPTHVICRMQVSQTSKFE